MSDIIYNSDNEIHFFSSFEEKNTHDLTEMAKSTPEQRFRNIYILLQNLYAEELKKPITDYNLYFD